MGMPVSKKPCPGCKEVNKERYADSVCIDCKNNIADGKKYKALMAEANKSKEFVRFDYEHRTYFYYGVQHSNEPDLYRGLVNLVEHLSKETKEYYVSSAPNMQLHGYWNSDMKSVYMKKDTAELLTKVASLAEEALKKAYKAGLEDGKNVLFGLNNGTLTLKDFDDNRK